MALEGITLDQLRIFLTIAEQRSFSAAAKRLARAQSAVSYAIGNLEAQLGVPLFDRTGHRPALTEAGRALLADAGTVLEKVDTLRARARSLSEGIEGELSLVVDVMFPTERITSLLTGFQAAYPHVLLNLRVEALGAVPELVLSGVCRLGIQGSLPDVPDELERRVLAPVRVIPVASPDHPLAQHDDLISDDMVREHVQLVLTDRSRRTEGRNFGVISTRTMKLADLGSKHDFLRAGLGWGNMPEPVVRDDLHSGKLVRLRLRTMIDLPMPFYMINRRNDPPGPAGRWIVENIVRQTA